MKAAVLFETKARLKIIDVELEAPNAKQVRVKVKATGCSTQCPLLAKRAVS